MAYFPDLSPYAYGSGAGEAGVVHVGWLDGVHPFATGLVSSNFVEKLKKIACNPVELYRGFHVCELCEPPQEIKKMIGDAIEQTTAWWEWAKHRAGNGEVRVVYDGTTYAAPVLIVHYIEVHSYVPPLEFLRAVEVAGIK